MGLKYNFKVKTLMDETIAYPEGKDAGKLNSVLALNETGAEIFRLLQQEMDEPAIVAALQEKYGADDANLPAFVSAFLDKLRKAGILE